MKNTKPAAPSSKAPPVNKLAQDLFHAAEILALFKEKAPDMIPILGKFQATPMLYHLVAHQIESVLCSLVPREEYTPAELIGDEDWSAFRLEAQRSMALCVKHFAAHPESTLVDLKNGLFTRT